MTPDGTSYELDVQNEWEENTHTLCGFGLFRGELSGALSGAYSKRNKSILLLQSSIVLYYNVFRKSYLPLAFDLLHPATHTGLGSSVFGCSEISSLKLFFHSGTKLVTQSVVQVRLNCQRIWSPHILADWA